MERPEDLLNETLYIIHGGFHQNSTERFCFKKLSKPFIKRKLKMRQLSVLTYNQVMKSTVPGYVVLQMLRIQNPLYIKQLIYIYNRIFKINKNSYKQVVSFFIEDFLILSPFNIPP